MDHERVFLTPINAPDAKNVIKFLMTILHNVPQDPSWSYLKVNLKGDDEETVIVDGDPGKMTDALLKQQTRLAETGLRLTGNLRVYKNALGAAASHIVVLSRHSLETPWYLAFYKQAHLGDRDSPFAPFRAVISNPDEYMNQMKRDLNARGLMRHVQAQLNHTEYDIGD